MNSSLQTTFSNTKDSVTDFAALEQEYKPPSSDGATIADAIAMLNYVKQGSSAFDYIVDNCSAVKVVDGVVIITLGFFVWPSRLDLPYTLHTTAGVISDTVTSYSEPRMFNVIFTNSDVEDIGYLFEGSFVNEMPFYTSKGRDISPDPKIIVDSPLVRLSTKCNTVLRANVVASGYRHELEISLTSEEVTKVDRTTGNEVTVSGYALPSPTIFVDWGSDEDHGDAYDSLSLEIPTCVQTLLETCDEGSLASSLDETESSSNYVVYWDTCSGEILDQFWVEDE